MENTKPTHPDTSLDKPATWADVEYAKLLHSSNPTFDGNLDKESKWADGQEKSKTRREIISVIIEKSVALNSRCMKFYEKSPEMLTAIPPITAVEVKFKDDPETVTIDIPWYTGLQPTPEFAKSLAKNHPEQYGYLVKDFPKEAAETQKVKKESLQCK